MKKTIYLWLLFFGTLSYAYGQSSIVITKINGIDATIYLNNNNEILEGTSLDITGEYTNIDTNPNTGLNIIVRFLDNWTVFPETSVIVPVTTSESTQVFTTTITAPFIDQDKYPVRIQAFGWNSDEARNFFFYAGEGATGITFSVKKDLTLANNSFAKSELEGAYFDGMSSIIIKGNVSGDFTIYNITGIAVVKGTISNIIDVSSLSAGVYILVTKTGIIKFIK